MPCNPQRMEKDQEMSILVGREAPGFISQAVLANGEVVDDFDLSKFIAEKYAAVFFYPLDFTFVCPSEIIAFAHRTEVLAALGCEVVAISTDSHFTHTAWRNTPVEQGGVGSVPFPMVADMTREITSAYGVLSERELVLPSRGRDARDICDRSAGDCSAPDR